MVLGFAECKACAARAPSRATDEGFILMSHQARITGHSSSRKAALQASPSAFTSAQDKPATDIRSALRDAIVQLELERVPSAGLAAELLLMHTLMRDRAWLYAHHEQELDAAAHERYFSLIAQRASGVPTQHLTGHQEFWGLDFEVSSDVLIPRPETEHVIEVALERLGIRQSSSESPAEPSRRLQIADVGTGSGCIAVALAHELPSAHIVATDISAAALQVARRNAARHHVSSRIDFVKSNLLDDVFHESRITSHGSRDFDLIVSNPPYIGRCEAVTLPREVREHEPEVALFGGEKGTEMYAPLIAQAAKLLKPSGILVLELGHSSAEHVARLLGPPDWFELAITDDLAGIPRVASAERST